MTLVVTAPVRRLAERQYVLDVVLSEWLGLDYDLSATDDRQVTIALAGDPGGASVTLPDVLFSTPDGEWLTERSLPVLPLARSGGLPITIPARSGDLPVVFGSAGDTRPQGEVSPGSIALDIDIFGSVFFLLSRYEEAVIPVRDAHGRFPASASLASRGAFLDRPLADEYVDHLSTAMHALWPGLARRPTPFRLRLTHDVDTPFAAWGQRPRAVARAVAGDVFRRRDPALAVRRVRSVVDARSGRVDRDPLNTFDFLMDVSERHGLRSTFFFMAGNTPADHDFRYRLSDPPVASLLRRVHERGHEVGLHASYVSLHSPERTRGEFDALRAECRAAGFEQEAWGVRQHYLRLDTPGTWRDHESAGLVYDSTLGFAEQVGFRAGTCREYPLFDLHERRTLALNERPLVVMDATLLEYLGLGLDAAAARALEIVAACRRHGGEAVILYHNSSLSGSREQAHYRDLVAAMAGPG